MADLNTTTDPLCTDEHLLIMAPGDFAELAREGLYAKGSDGAIQSSSKWTLNSASFGFAAAGVAAGMVCALRSTTPGDLAGGPNDFLVVDSVAANAITLRRKGEVAGVGQPPCPAGTSKTGLNFSVLSLMPFIRQCSFDMGREVGIDEGTIGRRSSDLYDPREVRTAVAHLVLWRRYQDASRGDQANSEYRNKMVLHRDEYRAIIVRLNVHFNNAFSGGETVNRQLRVNR